MKAKKILAGLSAVAIAAAMAGAVPFTGAQFLDTAVTASAEDAEVTTITWSSATHSFDKEGVSVSGSGFFYDNVYGDWVLQSCTFTTELGNFTKIEIVGGYYKQSTSDGWSDRTWTGEADSVDYDGTLTNFGSEKNFTVTFTIEPKSDAETHEMTATYTVDPSYTVTIPADVTITDEGSAAEIAASDVLLEDGQKIKVALTGATNTAEGSVFTAKNGTSEIKYSITEGEEENTKTIALGDTVAEFNAAGSQELTFTKTGGSPTLAGDHTENLTFTVSVTKSLVVPISETEDTVTLNYTEGQTWKEACTFLDEDQLDAFNAQRFNGEDNGFTPGFYSYYNDFNGEYNVSYYSGGTVYYMLYKYNVSYWINVYGDEVISPDAEYTFGTDD